MSDESLRVLVARLRAAGTPEADIFRLVSGAIQQFSAPVMLEAQRERSAYWKSFVFTGRERPEVYETQIAAARLYREHIVKSGLWQQEPDTVTRMRDRFGDLPTAKLQALLLAESETRSAQLQRALDAPAAKLVPGERRSADASAQYRKVDDDEREKAYQSVLTADEYADYQMRQSPLAGKVRAALVPFQATEEEYAAIYAIEKTLSEDFAFQTLTRPEQQNRKNEAVAAALPPERAADYAYLNAPNNQAKLMMRLGLPLSTIGTLDNQSTRVSDAINAIGQDNSLSTQEKLSRYRAMLADTKAQITTTLGAEAADAYTRSNRRNPVSSLEELIAKTAKDSGP